MGVWRFDGGLVVGDERVWGGLVYFSGMRGEVISGDEMSLCASTPDLGPSGHVLATTVIVLFGDTKMGL